MNNHIELAQVVPNEQFGFKAGHSTCHQLVRVTKMINAGFEAKKSTGMVLLDVEKAYDTVWHDAVIRKLHVSRCPIYFVKLVQSFLTQRQFQITVNGTLSGCHSIPFGLPQGSVLSPTLYNVFTSDVEKVGDVVYGFFADDTSFLTTHDDAKIVTTKLQHAQNKLEEYQHRWRIKINPLKTQIVFFTKRRAVHHFPSSMLKINGIPVKWTTEGKYLGLILDQKLLFDKHINESIAKENWLTRALYPLINRRSALQLANK